MLRNFGQCFISKGFRNETKWYSKRNGPFRNFSKKFRSISIILDFKIGIEISATIEIFWNYFEKFQSSGQRSKWISINFYRWPNDRKWSKFWRDRNEIDRNKFRKISIETKWTISINFATSCVIASQRFLYLASGL